MPQVVFEREKSLFRNKPMLPLRAPGRCARLCLYEPASTTRKPRPMRQSSATCENVDGALYYTVNCVTGEMTLS